MKKKLVSLLLTICLVAGLMPTAAFAGTDTGKAIQLVDSGTAANIGGGQADNIYFGTYQQSNAGSEEPDGTEGVDWINSGTATYKGQGPYYYIEPVKWRVLSNANGQLFLLSDQNLDVFPYHTDYENVTWEKSTMRSWLNGYGASENTGGDSGTDYTNDNFINTAFSSEEKGAIAQTHVYNATQSDGNSDPNPSYSTSGGKDTTDKIFLLSIEETNNSGYFPNENSSRISTNTAYVTGGGKTGSYNMSAVGKADYWWLRSPGDDDDYAAFVNGTGGVYSIGKYVDYAYFAVRPAFHLDLNSVLFTSAAVGGKIPAAGSGGNQGAVGADAIFEIGDYAGNEWKLTLLDSSRNFAISNAKIEESKIDFSYSNAQTGTNEYISVVIEDNGAITHYGRILQLDGTTGSASGTASLTLPAGVTLDNDTKLYVFNEQYNGGEKDDTKLTDYGSKLIDVQSAVDTTAPTLTAGTATRISETTATVTFTSDEAGEYFYEVVESGAAAPTIDTAGTGTSCDTTEQTFSLNNLLGNGAKDIYIVVKDAVGNVSQPLKIGIPAYSPPYVPPTKTLSQLAIEKIRAAKPGDTVELTPSAGQTNQLDKEVFEELMVKDITLKVNLSGGVSWTVNGKDIPENATLTDIDLGVSMNTSTIPVDMINMVTGEKGAVQMTLAHNGEFGFTMTLTAPLGVENKGLWANLYHYDTTRKQMLFETAARVDASGNVALKLSHASEYAIVLDAKSHELPFTDTTKGAWYQGAVEYVYRNGIMTGTSATTFEPGTTLSRAMVAQILYNLEGQPDISQENLGYPYSDVDAEAWYGDAVYWARINGVATGYEDNTFRPNRAVTREELAQMLYNYAKYKEIILPAVGDLSKFSDGDKVSSWAQTAMKWATGLGVINGYEDNTLRPGGSTTRAEAASMIMGLATTLTK